MSKKPETVDLAVIDRLAEVEAGRKAMADRLGRLEAEKESISSPVYDRVRADYESRLDAASREAGELVDRIRADHGDLDGRITRLEEEMRARELDREELAVRHRLGEFDDAELAARAARIDGVLEPATEDLGRLVEIRQRIEAAVGGETKRTSAPSGAPESRVEEDPALEAPAADRPAVEKPVPEKAAVERAPAETPPVETPSLEKPPVEKPPAERPAVESPVVEKIVAEPLTTGAVATAARGASSSATELLPLAFLAPLTGDEEGEIIPLGPVISLGRTADNDITIDEDAVSRRHAEVTLEDDGFAIRDLGSQNGTYVNGDAIDVRPLASGDRIMIGTVRFVFHSG